MRRLWIGLMLALASVAAAKAEPARLTCNNGDTSYIPNPDRAKVIGVGKVFFISDDPDKACPDTTPACRRKAYVMPGDVVLTSVASDGFMCGYLPNPEGGTGGYLPLDRLQVLPPLPDAPLTAWVGTWVNGAATIRISAKGNALAVDAEAGPNKTHAADLGAVVHNYAMFEEIVGKRDCIIEMTLILDALEVQDNDDCGAGHARFVGEFHRAK
jgi:hypothetical protein